MWQVSRSVHISEFPTDILIKELYNRVGDFLYDEEPKHEPHLEEVSVALLQHLKDALRAVDS